MALVKHLGFRASCLILLRYRKPRPSTPTKLGYHTKRHYHHHEGPDLQSPEPIYSCGRCRHANSWTKANSNQSGGCRAQYGRRHERGPPYGSPRYACCGHRLCGSRGKHWRGTEIYGRPAGEDWRVLLGLFKVVCCSHLPIVTVTELIQQTLPTTAPGPMPSML